MWTRVFGAEGNRGLGVEMSYLFPLPWSCEVIGSTTDATGEGTARSFFGADNPAIASPLDFQHTLALKQFFPLSDDLSLLVGLSGAFGPNPSGYHNRSEVYGADVYFKHRPITTGGHTSLSLQVEWLLRRRQVPGDVLRDTGGYATLLWQFSRRWAVAGRHEYGSPVWDRSGGQTSEDYLDPLWQGHRHRTTAALTFWPSEFSRMRLQGSMDTATPAEAAWSLLLGFEVAIGAHGAHAF
jgi:hypothetical protein